MAYVLSGGPLGGLGGVSDSDARKQLASLFTTTTSQWSNMIDNAVKNLPFSFFPSPARGRLQAIQNKLIGQVNPEGLKVISDPSIPLDVVTKRVTDFLDGYFVDLKGQVAADLDIAAIGTMSGMLKNLKDSFESVIRSTAKGAMQIVVAGAKAATEDLPSWVLPLGGLALAAYLWNTFRRQR